MKRNVLIAALFFAAVLFGTGKAFAQKDSIHVKAYAALNANGLQVPYEYNRHAIGNHDVLAEVLYCGICHSDVHEAFNDWDYTAYPDVSGHEMVGRVIKVGKDVTRFKKGDYIGIGAVQASCMKCEQCKKGNEQFCTHEDGAGYPEFADTRGFSDKMVINEHFGITIPKDAPIEKLGPIMCAGITVYSPLKAAHIKKGDQVAIAGFGGLGHLAVMYAKAFGAEVTVFDRTEEKRALAQELGAKDYVNVNDSADMSSFQGKFDYVLSTIPTHYDPIQYMNMLKVGGEFLLVGLPATTEAPDININAIPFGIRIAKSLMGGIAETQEAMDFSISHGIYPMVEVISVDKMNEAFQKVKEGKVHFRYVVDMRTIGKTKK